MRTANARAKLSTDDASWTCPAEGSEKIRERRQNCFRQPGHSPDTSGENHESVAVLAERGRRRAPRFGGFHQAEPTRSATASTAASALTNGRVRVFVQRPAASVHEPPGLDHRREGPLGGLARV